MFAVLKYTSNTTSLWLTGNSNSHRDGYRFSFNGMEKDNETYGEGNAYDFGARIYDSRLGRWLSVDPLWKKYPGLTTYAFSVNSPLFLNDVDGKDFRKSICTDQNGNKIITIESTIHLYGPDAELIGKELSGLHASGETNIDGQKYQVIINVNYVVNKSLDAVISANSHERLEQRPPDASKYLTQGVIPGDNIMYIKQKLPGPNGNTSQGLNSGRVKAINKTTLIHESFHQLGLDGRYCDVPGASTYIDPHFENDYMASGPDRNEFNPIHIYDFAKFALTTRTPDGPVKGPYVDNTNGEFFPGHKPESESDYTLKFNATKNVKVQEHY